MQGQDIVDMLLADEPRIATAISSGAGWEIWMQVEFFILSMAKAWSVARELPYPAPSAQKLDFGLQDNKVNFAVELKVESATTAGAGFLPSFRADLVKIAAYTGVPAGNRFVVGIAYSGAAKAASAAVAGAGVTYKAGTSIGVLVQKV